MGYVKIIKTNLETNEVFYKEYSEDSLIPSLTDDEYYDFEEFKAEEKRFRDRYSDKQKIKTY